MNRIEKPTGIILTIPQNFLREYPGGESRFRRAMGAVNEGAMIWNQTISAFPKHEILHCYLCMNGKIAYRLNIAGYDEGTKVFNDPKPTGDGLEIVRRSLGHKKWVLLCAPVELAPTEIPYKGFQGFRYTQDLW